MYTHKLISDGVYAIDEDKMVTIYLVCGENKAILIDTGCGSGSLKAYSKKLFQGDIAVLHTHTHGDHIGCDCEFTEIYVSEKDVQPLIVSGIDRECIRFLKEGNTIDIGGRSLTVYETPGHTKGSLVFADEKNGLLFAGDNVSDEPVWLMPADSDMDSYIASMKKLFDIAPRYTKILGCHGKNEQTQEQIKYLIECVDEYRKGMLPAEEIVTWGEKHKICSTGKAAILVE